MTGPENIFWDSCVFIRYLTENPRDYVDDIARYITDAKHGRRQIYYSTIAYTEIRPRHLRPYQTIQRLFADWGRAFVPIEPNPNILINAGILRDANITNPGGENHNRSIGGPDAIQLMSCVFARDVMGVSDVVFHTFDSGKNSKRGEKSVPLLGFERWFLKEDRSEQIESVCSLTRTEPRYPDRDLLSGGRDE